MSMIQIKQSIPRKNGIVLPILGVTGILSVISGITASYLLNPKHDETKRALFRTVNPKNIYDGLSNPKMKKDFELDSFKYSEFEGDKMFWITIATKPSKFLNKMLDHTEKSNTPVTVIGMGDNRLKTYGNGFGLKIQLLKESLERIKYLHGEEANNFIIVFTDAYDVLPLTNGTEIIKEFKKFNRDLVFSAETNCHPDHSRSDEYKRINPSKKDTKYLYLNSGTFAGRLGALLERIEQNKFIISDDDQRYWTNIYLRELEKKKEKSQFILDHDNRLFNCLAFAVKDMVLDRKEKTFYNKHTQTYPKILHFNGCKIPHFVRFDRKLRWLNR